MVTSSRKRDKMDR